MVFDWCIVLCCSRPDVQSTHLQAHVTEDKGSHHLHPN